MEKFRKILPYSFVIFGTVVLQLSMNDGYFDATPTKALIFRIGMTLLMLLSLICGINKKDKFNNLEKIMLFIPITFLVSSLFSYNFRSSFFGDSGWYVGSFTIIMGMVMALYLGRSDINHDSILDIIAFANFIILGIGFIQGYCNEDPFNLRTNLIERQKYSYISTIGNVNWMVGYLCLNLPILAIHNLERKSPNLISLIALIFGLENLIMINSDGIYLGLGILAFFFIPWILKSERRTRLFALYIQLFAIIAVGAQERYPYLTSLTKIFTDPLFIVGLYLISLSLQYICYYKIHNIAHKRFIVIFEGLLACGLLYFVRDLISAYNSYNYYWGNNRLLIWKESANIYKNYFTTKQQLFGVGPEMLRDWYYYLSEDLNIRVLVSHSEPIQILLTTGFVGLTVYIVSIVKGFMCSKNNIYFFPLIAYLGQSLVNSATVPNVCLFFIFLGLFINQYRLNKTSQI